MIAIKNYYKKLPRVHWDVYCRLSNVTIEKCTQEKNLTLFFKKNFGYVFKNHRISQILQDCERNLWKGYILR